jgi:uncharacterized protein
MLRVLVFQPSASHEHYSTLYPLYEPRLQELAPVACLCQLQLPTKHLFPTTKTKSSNKIKSITMTLGNPAPLGLIAFGMSTMLLMYVDMGWVEHDFQAYLYAMCMFLGGFGQVLVAIFELIKGSSFSFAAFGCYGFFWISWSTIFINKQSTSSLLGTEIGEYEYSAGVSAYLAQWGVLTFCFWTLTLRKNICLIVVFGLLTVTFFLLSIAHARADTNPSITKVAGYFGFFTAVSAFYTGIAELVNEEYGRHILPGLEPLHQPERLVITQELVEKNMSYDKATNTLMMYFRGFQIMSTDAIEAIRQAVEHTIVSEKTPDNKVHVIVDYKDVTIKKELQQEYWTMTAALENQYYLSVRRFAVTSFGTKSQTSELLPQATDFKDC